MVNFIKSFLSKAILLIVVLSISSGVFAKPIITAFNPVSGMAGSSVTNRHDIVIPNITNKPIISFGFTGKVKKVPINSISSLKNNGTLQLYGCITNNGIFTSITVNVTFNGTLEQTTSGINGTIGSLKINNSSSANNIDATNTLTLTTDLLNLGAKNLALRISVSLTGTPGITNIIVNTSTDEIRRIFASNCSFVYPVGDKIGTTEYSPIILYFTSDSISPAFKGVTLSNSEFANNAINTDNLYRNWTVNKSGIAGFSCNFTAQ